MLRIITKILLTVFALLLIAEFVPGVHVSGFYIALIVALLLGVINVTLKPILLVLTLPINLLTLGLFTFIINALVFWFVASFIEGFTVDGFVPALLGSLILALINWAGNKLL